MATHVLKTESWAFDATAVGLKMFEIRYNDRGYQAGDTVILQRLHPDSKVIDSGTKSREYKITYVTHFSQKEGWCVFGLKPLGLNSE